MDTAETSLDVSAIAGKVKASPQGRLGTQLVMIGLTVMLVMFSAWRWSETDQHPGLHYPIRDGPLRHADAHLLPCSIHNLLPMMKWICHTAYAQGSDYAVIIPLMYR